MTEEIDPEVRKVTIEGYDIFYVYSDDNVDRLMRIMDSCRFWDNKFMKMRELRIKSRQWLYYE